MVRIIQCRMYEIPNNNGFFSNNVGGEGSLKWWSKGLIWVNFNVVRDERKKLSGGVRVRAREHDLSQVRLGRLC